MTYAVPPATEAKLRAAYATGSKEALRGEVSDAITEQRDTLKLPPKAAFRKRRFAVNLANNSLTRQDDFETFLTDFVKILNTEYPADDEDDLPP